MFIGISVSEVSVTIYHSLNKKDSTQVELVSVSHRALALRIRVM